MCREYTKVDGKVFRVNFEYMKQQRYVMLFVVERYQKSGDQGFENNYVRNNFMFASCFTCHSAQGSSIDGDITIFDYNQFLTRNSSEWFWTAFT